MRNLQDLEIGMVAGGVSVCTSTAAGGWRACMYPSTGDEPATPGTCTGISGSFKSGSTTMNYYCGGALSTNTYDGLKTFLATAATYCGVATDNNLYGYTSEVGNSGVGIGYQDASWSANLCTATE